MSGWNDGGRSEKGNNEEEKKRCLTGILNCKGVDFKQMTNFFPFQLDQIWVKTTTANALKVG